MTSSSGPSCSTRTSSRASRRSCRTSRRRSRRAKKEEEKKPKAEKPRREKPAKAPKPERPKKKRRGLAAAIIAVVLVGCLIAAGIVGHFTGLLYRFTAKTVAVQTLPDDTVAQFQNPLLEQAARDYAGKPTGELTVADLKGLTALYVCGDRYWFAAPQQGVDAAAAGVETAEVTDPSGQTVTTDALQADAIAASTTTATVKVAD